MVCHYFRHHARQIPWRETKDLYRIFVSAVMLQQMQVERVRKKYPGFVERFPDFAALAAAEQRVVPQAITDHKKFSLFTTGRRTGS